MKSLAAALFFVSTVVAADVARPVEGAAKAVAIAEAALTAKFGEKSVQAQRPFRVRFAAKNEKREAIWIVEGKDPQNPYQVGGVMLADIRQRDGSVLLAIVQK